MQLLTPIHSGPDGNKVSRQPAVGVRDRFASWSHRAGLHTILSRFCKSPSLLILNYHRIGDPDNTIYDPGVFSATAADLDQQLSFLTKHLHLTTLDHVIAMVEGRSPLTEPCCLITFDDGYLDNYQLAAPVLAAHGVQGLFFLPTSLIGTNAVPWWDMIAYIVKRSLHRQIRLSYPNALAFDLEVLHLNTALRQILDIYKSPGVDGELFVQNLEHACGVARPDGTDERLFLNWSEAAELLSMGMAIGSHTHSHRILGKLSLAQQYVELLTSRCLLETRLGTAINALAYPVGHRGSFSDDTMNVARRAGYRVAFSFYGGVNHRLGRQPFDLTRCGVDMALAERFQLQVLCATSFIGAFWP